VADLGTADPAMRAGLRERKKLATRQALSSAALRLAMERGLENVTIEDITAEADVALRTFRNYFASKYEAICAIGADRARRIGASLLERPASEPLWQALTSAVLQHYEGTDKAYGQETMIALRLILSSPAIRGEYLKINFEMQNALAAAIAERTGLDVEADMYPQIVAGAVTMASQVALRRWYRADPSVPLRPILELALHQLASACTQPAPAVEAVTSAPPHR
jgi:AcrR family transcriptional regulator